MAGTPMVVGSLRAATAAIAVLACTTTVSAQALVHAVVPGGNGPSASTTLVEIPVASDGAFGTPRALATAAGLLVDGPETSAGGQLAVWTVRPPLSTGAVPATVVAFDRSTGTLATAGTVTSLGVSDPSRLRFFPTIGLLVHSLTPAGATPIPGSEGVTVVRVSSDGRRLYGFRGGPARDRTIFILDLTTGALVRTIALPSDASLPLVTDDEQFVYFFTGFVGTWVLHKIDAVSGAELASTVLPVSDGTGTVITPGEMVVDESRQRVALSLNVLLAGPVSTPSDLWILDASTLQEVSRVPMRTILGLRLDPASGRLTVFDGSFVDRPVPSCTGRLHTVSIVTGQVENSMPADVQTQTPRCSQFALALPPQAPELADPVVNGSSVTLSWALDGLTTGFVVEAGSASGLADIATLPAPTGTSLTVPNVPAGTYFVRVRAANYVGSSPASNEVQVTVP